MKETDIKSFQSKIREFYVQNKREFPWRDTRDPYKIFVSEMMLQQTQTSRVLPKYEAFTDRFPSWESLSSTSFEQVLRMWLGLGYNRRAKYLYDSARIVVNSYYGVLPDTVEELVKLPGIGENTAGALLAFVYDIPAVFIETNIRRVFIHEFFSEDNKVDDKLIKQAVHQTLPNEHFREWYYALMDYGVHLAKSIENPNKKSRHYSIQSQFEGSRRQVRGHILKVLLENGSSTIDQLMFRDYDKEYIEEIITDLEREGIVTEQNNSFTISS